MTTTETCTHEHVEQIGTTTLGDMITECLRCGYKKCEGCSAVLLASDPDVCELCDLHAHDDDREAR